MGFLRLILLVFTSLAVSSCLDIEEEVWINADASGAARIQVWLPEAAAKMQGGEEGVRKTIEGFVNSSTAFSSYSLNTQTEDRILHIDLTVTFDDAMDLAALETEGDASNLPPGSSELVGATSVDFSGLSLVYSRSTEFSKGIPGSFFIPESRLQGHGITTIFHLPMAASSHNATSTEDDGRTLIWKTPLAVAFKKPIENQFTMPLPIPWAGIALGTLLVMVLIGTGVYYFWNNRKKKKAL